MYTRCPHCTTIFRVTAEQLRTAHGDVPCVTCGQSFGALDSLSDHVTALIGPSSPAAAGTTAAHEEAPISDDATAEADDDGIAQFDDADRDAGTDDEDDGDDIGVEADTARHPAADHETDGDARPPTEDIDAEPPAGADAGAEDTPIDAGTADTDTEREGNEPGGGDDASPAEPGSEDGATEPPRTPADPDEDFSLGSLEFDAPEQTWTRFFVSPDTPATPGASPDDANGDADRPAMHADAASLADQTADPQEWQGFLEEIDSEATTVTEAVDPDAVIDAPDEDDACAEDAVEAAVNDDDETPREIPIIPPWLTDEAEPDDASQRPGRRLSRPALGVGAAALVLLCGQMIHYNRDRLAAHPTAGGTVRQFYALFDTPLYPQWSLDRYQITGTEAVTGRTAPDALDILANVIVGGERPVGLPLVRVVLQDRWSNPVASRVFTPAEYLRDGGAAKTTVTPGTALPIEISVVDPGADALGYVVDICLPRRKAGLECQIATDPFK